MDKKIYNIVIDSFDFETGMDAVSLVHDPAVEVDFLAFAKQEPVTMQFADDEKHIITGVALLADTPIYRIAPDGTEYYVVFTKEVIKQLVEKYFKFGLTNSVNIEHNDMSYVEGVTMIESYLIDKERGICPNEFASVPEGSWITSYKVNNVEVWDKIKSGEVKGFSIQGWFDLEERIDSQFSSMNTKTDNSKNKFFNKMSKLKDAIKNLLLQFSEVETDKGILTYEEEGELMVGYEVYMDGEPAADGEYKIDGKTIVVAEGKVTEIREDEKPAEEPTEPEEPKTEPEALENEEPKTEPEEPTEPETDEKDAKIADLEERIASLEAKLEELTQKVADLALTPAATPAEEEFENLKTPKTDPKNRMAAVAAAYRASKERK